MASNVNGDSSFVNFADRLASIAETINTKAKSSRTTPTVKSHYADAILTKPITDYVRDAELVESRLFTGSQVTAITGDTKPSTVDVKRKEVASATPLKKVREAPLALLEPEEYLRSVIRLTDKYDTMPRARAYAQDLLSQIDALRQNIPELERTLKELTNVTRGSSSAIKTKTRTLKEEERLTRETEARVAVLREQKASLLKRLSPVESSQDISDTSVFTSPSALRVGAGIGGNLLSTEPASSRAPPQRQPPRASQQPPRYTAQELRERRLARQLGRDGQVPVKAVAPALVVPSDEEEAFWSAPTPSSKGGVFANVSTETEETSTSQSGSQQISTQSENEVEADTTVDDDNDNDNDEGEGEGEGDGDGDDDVTIKMAPAASSAPRRTFSLLRNSVHNRPSAVPPVEDRTIVEEPDSPRSPSPPPVPQPASYSTVSESIPRGALNTRSAEFNAPDPAPEERVEEEEAAPQLEVPAEVETFVPGSELLYKFQRTHEVDAQLLHSWKTVGFGSLVTETALQSSMIIDPGVVLQVLTIFATQPVTSTSELARAELQQRLSGILQPYFASPTSHITLLSASTPTIIQVLSAALILQMFTSAYEGSSVVDQRKLKDSLRLHPWVNEDALAREVGNDPVSKVVYSVMGRKLIKVDRRENSVRFVDN